MCLLPCPLHSSLCPACVLTVSLLPPTLAGFPDNNATLWCDRNADTCYQFNMRPANHSTAEEWCDSQGGMLWWPRNASEELAVERWFGLLNNNHAVFLGIARGDVAGWGSNWTASDGETPVNMYPNTGSTTAYAHWGGDQFQSGGAFFQSSQD